MPRGLKAQPSRVVVPVSVKADDDGGLAVEGFANVYTVDGDEVVDAHGEVVRAGAFTKSVQERVPRGLVKFMDSHGWTAGAVLGTVVEAEDRKADGRHGLWFRAELSDTPESRTIVQKMREGHLNRASVGFNPIRVTYEERGDGEGATRVVPVHHEAKLMEVSVVPFAANEFSEIAAKSADPGRVVPFQDLPVASDDHVWEANAARERVEAWAAKAKGRTEARMRQAFVLAAPRTALEAKSAAGYSMQIADVVGGELRVVPRAVYSAAVALSAPGERFSGPGEIAAARLHVGRYLSAAGLVAPWDTEAALASDLALRAMGVQTDRASLTELVRAADSGTRAAIREALDAGPAASGSAPTDQRDKNAPTPMSADELLAGFDALAATLGGSSDAPGTEH